MYFRFDGKNGYSTEKTHFPRRFPACRQARWVLLTPKVPEENGLKALRQRLKNLENVEAQRIVKIQMTLFIQMFKVSVVMPYIKNDLVSYTQSILFLSLLTSRP